MAEAAGMSYEELIMQILKAAIKRIESRREFYC